MGRGRGRPRQGLGLVVPTLEVGCSLSSGCPGAGLPFGGGAHALPQSRLLHCRLSHVCPPPGPSTQLLCPDLCFHHALISSWGGAPPSQHWCGRSCARYSCPNLQTGRGDWCPAVVPVGPGLELGLTCGCQSWERPSQHAPGPSPPDSKHRW